MSFTIPTEVSSFISSYKYKIELHAHTRPVSSCSELSGADVVKRLAAHGFDQVVITNHFSKECRFYYSDDPIGEYLADYREALEAGNEKGVSVLLGAEYRFKENSNDYLVFGVDEAFLAETIKRFDELSFEQFYKEYHSEDILILQAHPFRSGMVQMPPDHMDGIEAFNMHLNHNSRVAKAARWAKANDVGIMTIGTDLHNPGCEGLCATRTKILPENNAQLVKLLRSKDYIMEIAGCPLLPNFDF